jgi:hypothetical protein
MASVWTDEIKRYVVTAVSGRVASRACVILASLCTLQVSYGQEPAVQEVDELQAIVVEQERLEEVVVVAPRSLNSIRAEILKVENNAIDLFNEINNDDDYDISCRRETPTLSYIPQRVCRPRFRDRIEARAAQDFLRGNGDLSVGAEIRQHQQILEERMRTLIEENPQLYEAMYEYYLIQTQYEAERQKRPFFSWR